MKFYYFFKNKWIKKIWFTTKRALLANKFNKTLRDLLRKILFEKDSGNWIKEINVVRKRFTEEKHFLTKLTPIYSFLEGSEGYVC